MLYKIKFQYVEDYCLAYFCDTKVQAGGLKVQWSLVAEACVCFDDTLWTDAKVELKVADSLFDSAVETKHNGTDLHALRR